MIETHTFKGSTLVASAACDVSAGLLSVTLHGDPQRTYGYAAVTPQTWQEFLAAESSGRYYNNVIRKNHLALGETTPLAEPLDDPFLVDEDFPEPPEPSEFDDVIAIIEAEHKKALAISGADMLFMDPIEPAPEAVSVTDIEIATRSAMVIPQERIKELQGRVTDYIANAMAITIVDNDTLIQAEKTFSAGKVFYSVLSEELVPVTKSHYEFWKAAKDDENRVLLPLETATDHLSREIGKYRREQERLAAIEQQKALEEARAAAQAEQQRQTEELKKQLAAENPEKASEILASTKIVAPPVPVFIPRQEILPPRTSGVTVRAKWVGIVDDFESLVLSVAEGIMDRKNGGTGAQHAPLDVLEANQSALNEEAKRYRERWAIPGVHAENHGGAVQSRKKGS